jgi:hypothetical protein
VKIFHLFFLACALTAIAQTPAPTSITVLEGTFSQVVLPGACMSLISYDTLAFSTGCQQTFTLVSFSATPVFVYGLGSNTFEVTLTGNVASSTVSGATAGQMATFIICQDPVGSRLFAWPPNFVSTTPINTAPGACTAETFAFDGTAYYGPPVSSSSVANVGGSPTVSVKVTSPQTLHTTPILAVPAQGTGTVISPTDVIVEFVGTNALSCTGSMGFGYGPSLAYFAASLGNNQLIYSTQTNVAETSNPSPLGGSFSDGAAIAAIANQPLYLGMSGANCTGGVGTTLTLSIQYRVVSGL